MAVKKVRKRGVRRLSLKGIGRKRGYTQTKHPSQSSTWRKIRRQGTTTTTTSTTTTTTT